MKISIKKYIILPTTKTSVDILTMRKFDQRDMKMSFISLDFSKIRKFYPISLRSHNTYFHLPKLGVYLPQTYLQTVGRYPSN